MPLRMTEAFLLVIGGNSTTFELTLRMTKSLILNTEWYEPISLVELRVIWPPSKVGLGWSNHTVKGVVQPPLVATL
jgi:hypothetical protein